MLRTVFAVTALLLAVATLPASEGAAQEAATSAAGVIVDTGDGEPIHVVITFAGEEITALEALRRADLGMVTVEFGGLGQAVCEIAETGCDVDACRQRVCQTGDPDSPFWQYWEQEVDGAWSLSPRGASHARLADGDVAAWVWTGTEPDLEPVDWPAMVAAAGGPDDLRTGTVTGEPAVYRSGSVDPDTGDAGGALAAAGIVALVGAAGGWLVLRQRRAAA